MSQNQEAQCDVLIVGAGLAGACLARQLRLRLPQLSVTVIDKKETFDYWVGESTVEVWEYYANVFLKLGPYLEKQHLLKHGLRFFFDSKDRDLPLDRMSETGRKWYFGLSARQLDRARFDADMCEMNRELGVDVQLGVAVKSIDFDREKGHVVHTDRGDIRCRYVVDAAGRASVLERLGVVDVHKDDERHRCASYWARYEGAKVIDEMGGDEWRRRVGYSHRFLSTSHFMYRGYWIWLIPVTDRIVSVGVSLNRDLHPDVIRNADELTEFFGRHRALRDMLDGAKALDFMGLKQLTRRSEASFSTDRWFMTGMSALFVDPLYSNTCAVIARQNLRIEAAIRTDLSGDEQLFKEQCRHFNIELRGEYEGLVEFVGGHLNTGYLDTFWCRYWPGLHQYYNHGVPDLLSGLRLELDQVKEHSEAGCFCDEELSVYAARNLGLGIVYRRWQQELASFLEENDKAFETNEGVFYENLTPSSLVDKMLAPDEPSQRPAAEKRITAVAYEFALRRILEVKGIPFPAEAFEPHFEDVYARYMEDPMTLPSLADGLTAMEAAARGAGAAGGDDSLDQGQRWKAIVTRRWAADPA